MRYADTPTRRYADTRHAPEPPNSIVGCFPNSQPGQNGSVGADLRAARREWQGKAEQSSDRDSGRLGDAALPTPGKTDSPHEGKAAGERDLSLLGAVSSTRNVSRLCLNPFIDHWQFLRFEFCTKLD